MSARLILAGLTQFARILLEVLLALVIQDASVMQLKDVCVQLLLLILAPTLDVASMLNVEQMVSVVYATVHPTIPPEIHESNVSKMNKSPSQ